MTWKLRFRRAIPAAVALISLAAVIPVPVAAAESVCRASADYCVEVNGAYVPDARLFVTENKNRILADIPSLSQSVLIRVKARKVVTVPPANMSREAGDSIVRLIDPMPPDAPVYALSIDGSALRFQIESAEVRVLKASDCRPVVMQPWKTGPVTDNSSARRCLRQEARPSSVTAVCMKGEFLKNSCDVPVVAVIQSTQYLFSGTLPETTSIVLPPGVEHSLGCVWSSGAMAPSKYEVLAAEFLPKQPGAEAAGHAAAGH